MKKEKRKVATTIYLDEDLHLKIRMQALQEKMSFTKFVEDIIREYIKKKEGGSKR